MRRRSRGLAASPLVRLTSFVRLAPLRFARKARPFGLTVATRKRPPTGALAIFVGSGIQPLFGNSGDLGHPDRTLLHRLVKTEMKRSDGWTSRRRRQPRSMRIDDQSSQKRKSGPIARKARLPPCSVASSRIDPSPWRRRSSPGLKSTLMPGTEAHRQRARDPVDIECARPCGAPALRVD